MVSSTSQPISGFSAAALASLTSDQIDFLQALPKAELHAHLNGSIPLHVLQSLASDYLQSESQANLHGQQSIIVPDHVRAGVESMRTGVTLNNINDFFELFPAIYTLTSTPATLSIATCGVLEQFLGPPNATSRNAQVTYLELRSTPRETATMSRMRYLETVLDEVEKYPKETAAVIVSLDRRMDDAVATECITAAVELRKQGRRVVGVDLCGDPMAGDMEEFGKHFRAAKQGGLGVTLHIAETKKNPNPESLQLLSYQPDRLGHATFLDETAKAIVLKNKTCIEICLSSNLLCKTVETIDAHHVRYYLERNHPIVICTDDSLPFRTSIVGEYALLMAASPLGLGLTEPEIIQIAKMGMNCRFTTCP